MTDDELRAEAENAASKLALRDPLLREITDALLAFAKAHEERERLRGMERAAAVADEWAKSRSCNWHDDDPCCHVRTGAGIAEKIRKIAALEKGAETT